MTDLTITQKIRLDLNQQIQKTEQEIEQKADAEKVYFLGWLKKKLNFYENSWHRVYDQQN